ncbi:hypothetical protein MJ923_14775 [Shewanella sp. 3B26]|uniref:Uncharacterized protein n=1 Tax=Shewanella zhuhaiensis TaxID=2919576 RepID=A0AAJ1BIS8_9GAMM|nr:hypothetical protein [Shewanella zhuhaiensis]MCH4295570.1 hypothetical protein [Shewanella zhuhaiensis]
MYVLIDDYLIAGDALKSLLADVPGVRKVYAQNELGDVDERAQVTPALHVLYQGDTLPDSAQGGTNVQVKQTWLVVVACRLSLHETPGKLIAGVLKAVAGKTATLENQTLGPFLRVPAAVKPRYTQSHAYFPLAFSVQLKFNNK